jgi:hypothetical protein
MDEEPNIRAPLLTGYRFFHNPSIPSLGVLRLDTKEDEPRWVSVTRKGLLELAKACAKHAEDLQDPQ